MQPECDTFDLFAYEVQHCGETRPYTEWLAEYEGDLHADWLMSQVRAADDEAARERQAIAAEMARVMPCYDYSGDTPF